MANQNREIKDRLFRKVLTDKDNKKDLLILFNELNGTDYTNEKDFTVQVVDETMYMSVKNEVACILDHFVTMSGPHSLLKPNLPIRGMISFAKVYEKYISTESLNLNSGRIQRIPTPAYFVLYNGTKEGPDCMNLRLSDSFMVKTEDGDYEWTAILLNIGCGHNKDLLNASALLKDYMSFLNRISALREDGKNPKDAINAAIEDGISQKLMNGYLKTHKGEVINLCLADYTEQETMSAYKMDGYEEGKTRGILQTLNGLISQGVLTEEAAAASQGWSVEEFRYMLSICS